MDVKASQRRCWMPRPFVGPGMDGTEPILQSWRQATYQVWRVALFLLLAIPVFRQFAPVRKIRVAAC